MRLGLLTGGGDCPGLNAVLRAVVLHAETTHGMRVVGIRSGLTGLMQSPPDAKPLGVAAVQGIHEWGGTILGTSNRGSPFREPAEAAASLKAVRRGWKSLKLDALIVVGGDGTQFMTRQLVEAGYGVVGVPKTIDNDLMGTELTVGFATAVEVASDAAARLATSAAAHDRIMVLEVMGRDAGHIALHAGLASGADAVLIPEIPFDFSVLAQSIKDRQRSGRNAYLIVAAEGAVPKGQGSKFQESPSGTRVLGGIGVEIARELHRRTGVDARTTVLGHLQRGGRPNAEDRILGASLGKRAVDLVEAGRFGRIVGVRGGRIVDFAYTDVQDERRLVDPASDLLQTAEALGITLGRKKKSGAR